MAHALSPLNSAQYRDIVRRALDEDIGTGDITTEATVRDDQQARGVFLIKADCVLAGLDVALEAFRLLDPSVRVTVWKQDGDRCQAGDEVAEIAGSARALLIGEDRKSVV